MVQQLAVAQQQQQQQAAFTLERLLTVVPGFVVDFFISDPL
jgi:hypothetical protein